MSDAAIRPSSWTDLAPTVRARVLLWLAAAGFLLGGLESALLRAQLSAAGATLVSPATYQQVMTLHGVSMVFLCVLPATFGLALGLLPARVAGGRTAFPWLSSFGVWVWVCGAAVLHLGLALGGTSGAGMLGNADMTSIEWAARETVYRGSWSFRAGGVDWWATSLALVTLGIVTVALDLAVTLVARRAPGVRFADFMPFTWNMLLALGLSLIAYPVLLVGLVMLQLDRLAVTSWLAPESGADPTAWARLTAMLGHPQVAMLIMPTMGLAGEAIANASGRGLLGRSAMRVSSLTLAVAGLLGWLAQVTPAGAAHARELLPVAGVLMALSIATAVSSWVATMWGRPLTAGPALSFALGLVVLVATGMFSALPLALQPEAARQVGTYFGVAHAHEMLFGGVVMGLVAGLYLHLPKVTGRAFDPALGQLHFALTLVGAVVTFLPMHVLGLVGMPRRIHTYLPGMGWDTLNAVATAGVVVMVLAGVVFAVAIARARPAGNAPSTAEPGRTPGPALLAAGLALLACGTLLGWTVGLVGLVVTVIGAVRAGVVRD